VEFANIKQVSRHLRCSNISDNKKNYALIIGRWISDGSEKRPPTEMLWSVSTKNEDLRIS